tara:strand:+ start:487 stop:798 length:312 start_codon:yes stop_codon:yes gene_type:complete
MGSSRNKSEKIHMEKISRLGCLICRKQGRMFVPAELHHIRDMTGMGTRSSHFEVIPLCVNHHRIGPKSFHENSKGFSKKWGTQRELLKETLDLLSQDDLIMGV